MPEPTPPSRVMHPAGILLVLAAAISAVHLTRGPAPDGGAEPLGYRLDLNQADAKTLRVLPGVGPTTADRIVDRREALGPYGEPRELLEVHRVGPGTLRRIEPWLEVPSAVVPDDQPLQPTQPVR